MPNLVGDVDRNPGQSLVQPQAQSPIGVLNLRKILVVAETTARQQDEEHREGADAEQRFTWLIA
jgi:hypothetical protein